MSEEIQVQALSDKQRLVLRTIEKYINDAGRPPTERYVAWRLGLHWTTVREHIHALYRKGWLEAPSPGVPRIRTLT